MTTVKIHWEWTDGATFLGPTDCVVNQGTFHIWFSFSCEENEKNVAANNGVSNKIVETVKEIIKYHGLPLNVSFATPTDVKNTLKELITSNLKDNMIEINEKDGVLEGVTILS